MLIEITPKTHLGKLLLRLMQCAASSDPLAFTDIDVSKAINEADGISRDTPNPAPDHSDDIDEGHHD